MNYRNRTAAGALAGAALLAVLTGCSLSPTTASSGADATTSNITANVDASAKTAITDLQATLGAATVTGTPKLCYITRTLSNEFWGFERDGFEAEAKKLGVPYQTFDVTDESSITEQLDKAQSAMNQGCTALLASPISATGLDSVFQAALDKGIPAIVLNDAKSSVPGVVYIGPDATT